MKPSFRPTAFLLFMILLLQFDFGNTVIADDDEAMSGLLRQIRAAPVNRRCRQPIGQPPPPAGQARPADNSNNSGDEDCAQEPVRRIPRQIEIQAARGGRRRYYRFERIRRIRRRG